jgi:hypothetical protein
MEGLRKDGIKTGLFYHWGGSRTLQNNGGNIFEEALF